MYLAGYLAAILIGISLGLIGGGGSILTVPVLVYLFGTDTVLATTYSLFIVGITSLVGFITYIRKGLVNFKMGIFFGIPSIAAVLLTRKYLVPAIPAELFHLGTFVLTRNMLLMLLFSILMIFASISMIKKKKPDADRMESSPIPLFSVCLQGIGVGTVTGLIGAGGGFLIIPALVNMLKLSIKTAVGTSLFIISINSLIGFSFSFQSHPIDWHFLLIISSIAIGGLLVGSFLSSRIDGAKLKPAFGWFVLIMGIYILLKEAVFK
jgi:uncharacterized membrane protein YfcA